MTAVHECAALCSGHVAPRPSWPRVVGGLRSADGRESKDHSPRSFARFGVSTKPGQLYSGPARERGGIVRPLKRFDPDSDQESRTECQKERVIELTGLLGSHNRE